MSQTNNDIAIELWPIAARQEKERDAEYEAFRRIIIRLEDAQRSGESDLELKSVDEIIAKLPLAKAS